MRRVLAVHPNADMLDLMAGALRDQFPDVMVEIARNALMASDQCRAQAGDPFRAVIANCSIASDFKTRPNDSEYRGMEFLESLGTLGHGDAPKLLIATLATNSLLARVENLPHCKMLLMEDTSKFVDSFVEAVRRALEHSSENGDEQEQREIRVVVSLNMAQQVWEYELKGVGFPYTTQRTALQIDSPSLERLVRRSRWAVYNPNDWEQELLDIGQEFGRLLFDGNRPFWRALRDAEIKAGGADRKSICFSIEKTVYPAALEALTEPDDESFWMLKVPMYRRLIHFPQAAPTQRTVLFKGRSRRPEPFNVLIIESASEGIVDGLADGHGRPLRLPKLGNVKPEADAVEAILRPRAQQLTRIGRADVPAGSSFKSYVQEVLKTGKWDLVHYAGHSYYDEVNAKGYLLFPGEDAAEPLDIEIFNTHLDRAQTRFIYLSGCQSSEAGFVFELAKLQLPGVLGFRWPINDGPALEFARTFYAALFKGASPCLEKAFLETRRAIRESFKQDKIWAAAMLILQDGD